MRVDIIGSGSNGNCTLFRSDAHDEWVMFDCGVPNVKRKIKEYKVIATFITHCHSDHAGKLKYLPKDIDIYGTFGELNDTRVLSQFEDTDRLHYVEYGELLRVGPYVVIPIAASHDTPEPCHYIVTDGVEYFFYGCDTNILPESLDEYFDVCDAIMIECDYDTFAMQADIINMQPVIYEYNSELKERVMKTHCSTAYIMKRMFKYLRKTSVILGHISSNYNSKKNMEYLFPSTIVVDRTDCPLSLQTISPSSDSESCDVSRNILSKVVEG